MKPEFMAKKQFGQHWLKDKSVLQSIVDAADLKPTDTVLEIGPGTGNLTQLILSCGAKLLALEFDKTLIPDLENRFGHEASIEHGDIRQFNLTRLPAGYKIVSNIPYYLTANLLRLLTETVNKPAIAVLLIQKEVAQRVAASPGQMSVISVAVGLYYQVSLGQLVPAKLFEPSPKVDSQVLIIKARKKPLFVNIDERRYLSIAKAGFSNKRKTLLNALSGGLRLSKEPVSQWLQIANISPQSRAQELSMNDWHKLYLNQP